MPDDRAHAGNDPAAVLEGLPPYPFPNPTALEPPPEWAQLRARCPVARIELASGDEALLLTRYDDVRAMLSDPRFSRQLDADDASRVSDSDDGGVFSRPSASTGGEPAADEPEASMLGGPGHRRWRRLVGKAFTVKRVQALRPGMTELAEQLITDMVEAGAPASIGPALGFPLPVFVICDLLGVPRDDRGRFAHWSDTMLNMTRFGQDEIDRSGREFYQYMTELVAAKRSAPGDDLLSALAADMTATELVMTGQGLLIAGHETTANMIGKMVAMLLADREHRWERLLADPALVPSAVEEALRFDANPGFGMPRYVSEETVVGGATLPRGTTVVCSMASGNRDTDAFDGAGDMDLARRPNPHLAFGVGPHSCVGQQLARVELQTVLEVLLRRLPTLELVGHAADLRARQGLIVGGIDQVLVRW
ncbi:cytochrome P450 [Amycolatopsis sp. WQ 127309]|uniref:cytochrome P450 n=1 Tax=Amycolatopsis sp. WQ 127309 TaxID=2932773 RepID=UPI001FF6094D|nr:cytochrome P450 [Amycolatopsis sp. WQ 127309]UOZ04924.1 cytochrome P450 [Amycolatopsis sp. WQ 127309]